MPEPMYPADLIQALADAGLLDDRLALAKYQLLKGAQAAGTPMPGMREAPDAVGGTALVGPHPLEYVNAILTQGRGNRDEAAAQQAMADMLRQYQGAARDKYTFDAKQAADALAAEEAKQAAAEAAQGSFVPQPQQITAAELLRAKGGRPAAKPIPKVSPSGPMSPNAAPYYPPGGWTPPGF